MTSALSPGDQFTYEGSRRASRANWLEPEQPEATELEEIEQPEATELEEIEQPEATELEESERQGHEHEGSELEVSETSHHHWQ